VRHQHAGDGGDDAGTVDPERGDGDAGHGVEASAGAPTRPTLGRGDTPLPY
jgi:hypothetical protein